MTTQSPPPPPPPQQQRLQHLPTPLRRTPPEPAPPQTQPPPSLSSSPQVRTDPSVSQKSPQPSQTPPQKCLRCLQRRRAGTAWRTRRAKCRCPAARAGTWRVFLHPHLQQIQRQRLSLRTSSRPPLLMTRHPPLVLPRLYSESRSLCDFYPTPPNPYPAFFFLFFWLVVCFVIDATAKSAMSYQPVSVIVILEVFH